MKAILLAGGKGSRLFPVTSVVSKQLLPVYDKPMVYYPLSVLFLAGIQDILIISTPTDISQYQKLLGDGSQWGVSFQYKVQDQPNGLAEAFILGEKFIGSDPVCLILGDNIFYSDGFSSLLDTVVQRTLSTQKATIFGYTVRDPKRYGVIEYDSLGKAISIEEKPETPKSHEAVVGLYFYPNSVIDIAKQVNPSDRGELEITTVNQKYLELENLQVEVLGRGFAWLDTGTYESLLDAGQFIHTIEKRQGLKVGCLEEIAFEKGFITREQLLKGAEKMKLTDYGSYLIKKYND
ncbi:glucose-1-phosphate thymidylyltransferase RfbA [Flavobacteriaceae bacterium]|nr:glucose-1-phosphate thymidylyltransferase RfbA [Flavobacteriaceae bacterium]